MDVGFTGLGRMGRPMAKHLAEAGHYAPARSGVTGEPAGESMDGLMVVRIFLIDHDDRLLEKTLFVNR